jgi:hypothetical protein
MEAWTYRPPTTDPTVFISWTISLDKFVKSRNSAKFVIPAKAGIQLFQDVLDRGACPGRDPGFAGVTTQETFSDPIEP